MINLEKGSSVNLAKGSGEFTLRCTWSSETDYDLYALVLYQDGTVETVATFAATDRNDPKRISEHPAMQTSGGEVVHEGDVGRDHGDTAEEVIRIRLTDKIRAVVPVCYSAQSNGTGSFRKYRVSMEVTGPEDSVQVDAKHADRNPRVYTCVPGIIENGDSVKVTHVEEYSNPGSEYRPMVQIQKGRVQLVMDAGARNIYK